MILTPTEPELYHTSILLGQMWVDELLDGHPDHICCELGLQKGTFHELLHTLCCFSAADSKHVSLEEQLAIFLYMSATGLTIQHTGEHFQCSNDTISKCFQKMLGIFSSAPFYMTYVTLPNTNTPPSQTILCNQKLWPFFQHALGAIDGTHIHSMYTSCKGMWHVSEPKRVFVPEFPVHVFIQSNIRLWVYWVGGISNGQPGVGGCAGLWI